MRAIATVPVRQGSLFPLINRLFCDQRSAGRLPRWLVVNIMTIALEKGKFAARRVRKTTGPLKGGSHAAEARPPARLSILLTPVRKPLVPTPKRGKKLLHRLLESRLPRRDTADVLKVDTSFVVGLVITTAVAADLAYARIPHNRILPPSEFCTFNAGDHNLASSYRKRRLRRPL